MKLTPEDIRDAMGGISEQLITEAAEGSREIKERNRMKLLSVIASVVLVTAVTVSTAVALRQPAADSPDETTTAAEETDVTSTPTDHTATAKIDGFDITLTRTEAAGTITDVKVTAPEGIEAKLADTCGQYYKKMILEVTEKDGESYEKFCVEVDITTGEVNDFMRKCSYFDVESDDSWKLLLPDGIQPLTWRYDRSGVVMIAAVVPTDSGWSAYALWAYDSASSNLQRADLSSCDPASSYQRSNILILPKNGDGRLSSGDGGQYALLWYKSFAEFDPEPGDVEPPTLTVSKEASTFFDGLPLESTYTVTEGQTLDGTAMVTFFYGGDHITHIVNLYTGEITDSSVSDTPGTVVEVITEYDGRPLTFTYTESFGKITGVSFEPSEGYSFALADRSGNFYDKMVVLITHEVNNGINGRESFAAVLDIKTGEFDDFVRNDDVIWPYDNEFMFRTVTWQYNSKGAVMIALTDAASEKDPWSTVFAMWMYDQTSDRLERAEMDPYIGENIRLFGEIGSDSFAQFAILWRVQNKDGLVDIVLDACEALDKFPSLGLSVPAYSVSIESAVDWQLTVETGGVEYLVDLISGEVKKKDENYNLTKTYIDGHLVQIYWQELPDGGTYIINSITVDTALITILRTVHGGKKVLIETSGGHLTLCDLTTGDSDEFGREYLERTPGSDSFSCDFFKSLNENFVYALYISYDINSDGIGDPRLHAVYRFDLRDGSLESRELGDGSYLRTSGIYAIAYEMSKEGDPVNASGLDALFSAPGDDGYTVSEFDKAGKKLLKITDFESGEEYLLDLYSPAGHYKPHEMTANVGGVAVSLTMTEYGNGRIGEPSKTYPDDVGYDVFDIYDEGYALVRLDRTGGYYIVGLDGTVIGGAEKIFAAVGCDFSQCETSSDVGTRSMIVTVGGRYEVDGCTLVQHVFYVTYKTDGGVITDTETVELSALPDLVMFFEDHPAGAVSAQYMFGEEGYIGIEVRFVNSVDALMADDVPTTLISAMYDPEKGDIVDLNVTEF